MFSWDNHGKHWRAPSGHVKKCFPEAFCFEFCFDSSREKLKHSVWQTNWLSTSPIHPPGTPYHEIINWKMCWCIALPVCGPYSYRSVYSGSWVKVSGMLPSLSPGTSVSAGGESELQLSASWLEASLRCNWSGGQPLWRRLMQGDETSESF